MRTRFHLDESIKKAIANGLKQHGIAVTTTPDADLLSLSDEEQLAFCLSQDRVLITHDKDFTKLHSQDVPHAGICYCRQDKYSIGELLRTILLVYECLTPEELQNHLEYL